MTTKITHLLVDLDGTLVDGDTLRMRLEFLYRTVLSWKLKKGFFKTLQAFHSMRRAVESVPNGQTNEVRMVRAFAKNFQITDLEAKQILEKSVREVFPKLERHFSPIPGAASFLEWAKDHYPLILATNPIWNPEAVELRVRWAGLDLNHFKSFTHAKRMHSCKPRHQYYEELLEQEGLDPSSCLLIGNDRRKDLPASRIGISVFLVEQSKKRKLGSVCKSIVVRKNSAPSWSGTFSGLRKLLEERSWK